LQRIEGVFGVFDGKKTEEKGGPWKICRWEIYRRGFCGWEIPWWGKKAYPWNTLFIGCDDCGWVYIYLGGGIFLLVHAMERVGFDGGFCFVCTCRF